MNEYDMTDEEMMQLIAAKKRGGMPEGGMPEEDGGMGLGGMAAMGAGAIGAGLAATPMGRSLRGLIGKGVDAMAEPFGKVAGPAMQKIGDMAAPAMQGMGNMVETAGNALRGADEASGGFVGRGAENASAIASAVGAPFKSAMQGGQGALDAAAFARGGRSDAVDPFEFSMPALRQNFGDTMAMGRGAMEGFKDTMRGPIGPTPNPAVQMPPAALDTGSPNPIPAPPGSDNKGFTINYKLDGDAQEASIARKTPWETPPNAAVLPEPAAPPAGPTLEMPTEGTPFNPNVRGTEMPIPPAPTPNIGRFDEALSETFKKGGTIGRDMRSGILDNAAAAGVSENRVDALGRAIESLETVDSRNNFGKGWTNAARASFGKAFAKRSDAEKDLGRAYMEQAGLVKTNGTIEEETLTGVLSVIDAALRGGGDAV